MKVRVNAQKTGIELKNVKMSMNPFDEIAVEAAVQMKEKKSADEVVAVSVGAKGAQETLRTALAMGVDTGFHVETSLATDLELQSLAVAKTLKEVVKKFDSQLVIVGKQAIDDDSNATGQMLAQLLGWPQATNASEIKLSDDKKSVEVSREVDGGIQIIKCSLPAIVTTDLRLNTPRYTSLPNIMKARKKKIETVKIEDLGVDPSPRLKVLSVEDPPVREAGEVVDSVEALYDKLKNEAKVL